MTDPDNPNVDGNQSTTSLAPDEGEVLHRGLLLGQDCQCVLVLRHEGHNNLRIVSRTPIFCGVRVLFERYYNLEVHRPNRPGVALLLQHGMLLPGRAGRPCMLGQLFVQALVQLVVMWLFWNIFQNNPLPPIEQACHVLVINSRDYNMYPSAPDINYSVV